jgi:hypothetical protein
MQPSPFSYFVLFGIFISLGVAVHLVGKAKSGWFGKYTLPASIFLGAVLSVLAVIADRARQGKTVLYIDAAPVETPTLLGAEIEEIKRPDGRFDFRLSAKFHFRNILSKEVSVRRATFHVDPKDFAELKWSDENLKLRYLDSMDQAPNLQLPPYGSDQRNFDLGGSNIMLNALNHPVKGSVDFLYSGSEKGHHVELMFEKPQVGH